MRALLFLALLSLSVVDLAPTGALPYLSPRGIVNAASLTPSGLPGGSIARGSRFQMSGVGIGPRKPRADTHFPLKPSLGGVAITATVGTATYSVSPIYVSSTLVKAVLPSAIPAGPVSIRLTFNGRESNPVATFVVEHSPGLFSLNGRGDGPGRIFNTDRIDDEDDEDENDDEHGFSHEHRNSMGKSHRKGLVASLLGTGFGSGSDVDVFVGGLQAETFFARKSLRRPGLDVVAFRVPDEAPLGCYVPVQVVAEGAASNVVTMALSGRDRECSDDFNPGSRALREGGNVALALLSRVVFARQSGDFPSDLALATGRKLKRDDEAFERLVSWPPPGTCTVYSTELDLEIPGGSGLYLGHLLVTDAANTARPIRFIPPSFYEATWGRNDLAEPLHVPPPAFLQPGVFTFAGTGAGKVGSFAVRRTLGPPPVWTNAAGSREITRSDDLTVTWSGAADRRAFVMGSAASRRAGASAFFQCLAPAGASSLTIPAEILGRLPAVRPADRSGTAAMEVGAFAAGTPAKFSAVGLDTGVLFFTSASAQAVEFK